MAIHLHFPPPLSSLMPITKFGPTKCISQRLFFTKPVVCISSTNINGSSHDSMGYRRSGNYQPCIWDSDYLQSLTSDYTREIYTRVEKLKGETRKILGNVVEPLDQLEFIDALQRLGLGYHFDQEIKNLLQKIYYNSDFKSRKGDLHATALEFRLLRQHGLHVPQEVFKKFIVKMGSFKSCICDMRGMLSLYEASYFSLEGESIMEEAWELTTHHLKDLRLEDVDPTLAKLLKHALEIPLHWRMPRLEARWFIDIYAESSHMNPILLELAKLDFNIVQRVHQQDLSHTSSWWENLGLGEQLMFARDGLVPSFLWSVGVSSEPQFKNSRRMVTKAIALINVIDDIYDVYGTLDEVKLFTDVVERWDISAMKQLPHYMKICFLAFYNSVNRMAYTILNEQGVDILPYLKNTWVRLLKAYLVEARWYHSKYTPTMEEYMNNAWISIGSSVVISEAYLFALNPITEEQVKYLESNTDILRWTSVISRLSDDLGTSSEELKRGDVPKSIQCYMNETGASEVVARDHIRKLIRETWKKVNKYRVAESPLSPTLIEFMLNLSRMAQCMYEHGDGHAVEDGETKDRVLKLLFEPIPL